MLCLDMSAHEGPVVGLRMKSEQAHGSHGTATTAAEGANNGKLIL